MKTFNDINTKLLNSKQYNGLITTLKNEKKRNDEKALFCLHHAFEHNNVQPLNKWLLSIQTKTMQAFLKRYIKSLELPFIEVKNDLFSFKNEKPETLEVAFLMPYSEFEQYEQAKKEDAKKERDKGKVEHKNATIAQRAAAAKVEAAEKATAKALEQAENAALIAEKESKKNKAKAEKAKAEAEAKAKAEAEALEKAKAEAEKATERATKSKVEYLKGLGQLETSALIKALEPLAYRGLKGSDIEELKRALELAAMVTSNINTCLADTVPSAEVDSVAFNISNAIKPTTKERAAGKKSVA